ncbi:MAG: AAA family ATPase [Desertimonas sp.]
MRPLAITMEGFGAFRHRTVVDLTDADLVALTGPTGAGKSTIIDALTFALYGSVARYDDQRVVAPVINQTATEAKVQLDFELRGTAYRAVRVVRRTKNGATTPEARLERGDEVLAADARSMTVRVTDLLGLDAEQFNKTVVLPQGRFAQFLHDKPAERQATLRRLLDLGLYEQLGKLARARSARARSQADGFQDEATSRAAGLDDRHRDELDQRIDKVAAVLARLETAGIELDQLRDRQAELAKRGAEADERLARLSTVQPPDGVAELATEHDTACRAAETAEHALADAQRAQAAAREALAAGPDLSQARLHQAAHRRRRETRARRDELDRVGDGLRRRAAAAGDTLAGIDARLARLDDAADTAMAAARTAAALRDEAGDERAVTEAIAAHQRLATAAALRDEAAGRQAAAETTATRCDAELRRAEDAGRAANERLHHVELHAGASGLVGLLRRGEPCPVCRRQVETVPAVDDHDDLQAARRTATDAEQALTAARQAAATANDARSRAREAVRARDEALDADAAAAARCPDRAEAEDLLRVIVEAGVAAKESAQRAEAAQRALADARRDPAVETGRRAAAEADRRLAAHDGAVAAADEQLRAIDGELVDAPTAEAADRAVELAVRLGAERERCDQQVSRADRVLVETRRRVEALAGRMSSGREALAAARDRLAGLGAPVVDTDRLAAGWTTLESWVSSSIAATTAARAEIERERAAVATAADDLVADVRRTVASVAPDAAGDRAALRDAVVKAAGEADEARASFDRRRHELAALGERIGRLRETAAVADRLGRLLSVTGFESWLMESALTALSERATERLRQLSGGRFSLAVADREFLVRDHHHADELRSVRTLSGGETFLASLALALALSEATAELAAQGAPQIESIFLDEGFGTLDRETMDTVAGAIEELGAEGRMVVLVTHVEELADRVPVRVEVRPGPDGSSAERVDT